MGLINLLKAFERVSVSSLSRDLCIVMHQGFIWKDSSEIKGTHRTDDPWMGFPGEQGKPVGIYRQKDGSSPQSK